MKYIYIALLLSVAIIAKANHTPTLFDKINSINTCWSEQNDIQQLPIYVSLYTAYSDKQLIQQHLQLVEHVLRNRNTETLTHLQKENRNKNLDNLHQYWLTNNYPINNKTANRNPVFIDDYNTFCAVGYLIKTSGHEPLARKIAKTNNLSYLREMHIADLNQWVNNCGLTLDELAWIQPTYQGGNHSRSLGKGVNGPVYALEGNDATRILYVAGNFTMADETVSCKNIVSVNYDKQNIFTNTFSPLGEGLNGTVKALYRDGNILYAGGHFDSSGNTPVNNIAKWNGTIWEAMGTLNGTVKTITKYSNQIYVGGNFNYSYNNQTYQNLAFWDGTQWKPISEHMIGVVNVLKVIYETQLIVGGDFTHVDTMEVNHIFSYSAPFITKMEKGLPAQVYAIDMYDNRILAGGNIINPQNDSMFGYAIFIPQNQQWNLTYKNNYHYLPHTVDTTSRISTLSAKYVGGKLDAGFMYITTNTGKINEHDELDGFASTNGEVNTILKVGKRVFFGGLFTELYYPINSSTQTMTYPTGNLAIWDPDYVGLKNIEDPLLHFSISPNPTHSSAFIQAQAPIKSVSIYDVNGKLIWENTLSNYQKELNIERSLFPTSGLYFVTLQTETGQVENQKLLVD